MTHRMIALVLTVHALLHAPRAGHAPRARDGERGDVPGWVLITVIPLVWWPRCGRSPPLSFRRC